MRRAKRTMLDILDGDFDYSSDRRVMKPVYSSQTKVFETLPKHEFLVNSAQFCVGLPETVGLVFVTSDLAGIDYQPRILLLLPE